MRKNEERIVLNKKYYDIQFGCVYMDVLKLYLYIFRECVIVTAAQMTFYCGLILQLKYAYKFFLVFFPFFSIDSVPRFFGEELNNLWMCERNIENMLALKQTTVSRITEH